MFGAGRVRVYIGTTPSTTIAAKVLECSIMRRTEMQVDFVHMHGPRWEYDTTNMPEECDEYALRRWMIPAHAGYDGMALYLDAASLVMGDIWDLWTIPQQMATRGRYTAYCPYTGMNDTRIMLIDCKKARGQWPFDITEVCRQLRRQRCSLRDIQKGLFLSEEPCVLPADWMCLDYYQPGKSKLVHYGNDPCQPYPWHTGTHPYKQPWEMELCVAMQNGFVPPEVLEEYVNLWGSDDPRAMHEEYRRFIPTCKMMGHGKRRGRPRKAEAA